MRNLVLLVAFCMAAPFALLAQDPPQDQSKPPQQPALEKPGDAKPEPDAPAPKTDSQDQAKPSAPQQPVPSQPGLEKPSTAAPEPEPAAKTPAPAKGGGKASSRSAAKARRIRSSNDSVT